MSHARVRTAFPEAFKPKKLSAVKDKGERRFMVEDAARTFERLADVQADIKAIKTDEELFEATKSFLSEKAADTKKALKT